MERRLDRIEEKMDKMGDKISSIDSAMGVYNEQLKYHIKRTDQVEEIVKPIGEALPTIKFLGRAFVLLLSSEIVYRIISRFM